jgi:chorismate synthase
MFRWLTAGESHGPQHTVIIDGVPSGLELSAEDLRRDLARRQGGYGRGDRQKIEVDAAEITAGVRGGVTLGSPIALVVVNRDHANWIPQMTAAKEGFEPKPVTRLRPGHADLAGTLKYNHQDVRNVLERSSARESTARVAAGGVARALLRRFGIRIVSFVQSIGPIDIGYDGVDVASLTEEDIAASPVRCPDREATRRMMELIDEAREAGDTLGGTFRVVATGCPPGLGTFTQWDLKLDARLAAAVMSINAVKGVAIGAGFEGVARPGRDFHDQIDWSEGRFSHLSNNAGGITGGMTNGEPVDVRAAIKPISTMRTPLPSVDLVTKEHVQAHYERSDVCVVHAAGVIGEAMVALVLAEAFLEKFGGDSIEEIDRNLKGYLEQIRR